MMSRNLALTGMMGTGKSTLAVELGARLGRRVADTDDELRTWTGRSILELFAEHGEAGFRELERHVVEELASYHDLVIALGGGVVLDDANVAALLLTGVIVELHAEPAVLTARLTGAEADDRPLLAGDPDADPAEVRAAVESRLRATADARAARYREVADLHLDADREIEALTTDVLGWAMNQGDVLTPSEHEQVMTQVAAAREADAADPAEDAGGGTGDASSRG